MKKFVLSVFVVCLALVSFATGPITGVFSICVGATTILSCPPSGGSWTSSNPSVATIGSSSGMVTGMAAGVVIITYTDLSSGTATQAVTVNPNPGGILMLTTTAGLCVGSSAGASCTPSGGTWSSSNPSVASIGSSSGSVLGIGAGTCTITYTLATGCFSTRGVTINPSPSPITGTLTACVSGTTTLSSSPTGGTWASGSTSIATVGAGTGIVTGVAAGTASITYSASGCRVSTTVTVMPSPTAILGSGTICTGGVVTLSSITPGGTWSSSTTSVATIGSSTGILTAISTGTSTITYTGSSGCFVTRTVTVVTTPGPIAGPSSLCVGGTITLTSSTGGTWTSGTPSVATIGSASGSVSGVGAGTSVITYTLPGGCMSTTTITVSPTPGPITGGTVCAGATITLTASVAGTWSSGMTSTATVGSATGIVSGVTAGVAAITFTSSSGCTATTMVTVSPVPAAITGTFNVCIGQTTALSDATAGGTWSSASGGVASVGSLTGVVTGVAAGISVISYTLASGCAATAMVTVTACPALGIAPADQNKVDIFPNPAHDEFAIFITPGSFKSYSVTNEAGQVVMSGKLISAQTNVDIKILPAGLYYISVKGDGGRIVRQFVKM